MSQRVTKHRRINAAVKEHFDELNNIIQVDDIPTTANANDLNFMPLPVELLEGQSNSDCSHLESLMEEVRDAEGPDEHNHLGISIHQCNSSGSMSPVADNSIDLAETVPDDPLYLASTDEQNSDHDGIRTDLALWSIENGIKHTALNELLDILKQHHHNLPKDARTLLKTARTSEIHPMKDQNGAEGEYVYFGVERGLVEIFQGGCPSWLAKQGTISLLFNVDGLPLFKSSLKQFWPILCKVCDTTDHSAGSSVCTVAVFCGTSKPGCLDLYLQPLINELSAMKENGITVNGKIYKVQVLGFSCDAPARAYLKCIKGHSAYYGCEKCSQKGKKVDGRMTFPDLNAAKRTDKRFLLQKQEEHHKGVSPLLELGLGLVTSFPSDYMHLICLGVVKKLILYWLQGKRAVRLGPNQRQIISDGIVRLAPYLCVEFSRKLRPLKEVERWKAVEFRTFLLYNGPVVLRSAIPSAFYHHFMLLSTAVTILTSSALCHSMVEYADTLLRKFVSEAKVLYGAESLVYNMHNLIHLCDDVKNFGLLDEFSCFQFESKLGHLKKLLRSGSKALAQLCRRHSEMKTSRQLCQQPDTFAAYAKGNEVTLLKEHFEGPTAGYNGQQYCKLICRSYVIDTQKSSDCYMLTVKSEVVQIVNMISDLENNEVTFICRKFKDSENFFDYPCESKKVNIHRVSNLSKSFIVVS